MKYSVLRDGAESQRAECKGAERQGAEPNVPNCQIVDVIKCRNIHIIYWIFDNVLAKMP
jgi:hypothetical protein